MPLTNGGGRIMKKDIRFLVTNSCNYGCYFCHAEGVSGTLGKNELTVENYITLFNLYSELEGWNGVTLSGGEPFLFRDIDELLKRLYEAGAQVTVLQMEHCLTGIFRLSSTSKELMFLFTLQTRKCMGQSSEETGKNCMRLKIT